MDLDQLLRRRREGDEQALVYYRLLKSQRKLNSVLLAVLRCPRGCTLLTIFQTPNGPAFYQQRYKLSRAVNDSSSTAPGRDANTEDGNRRWKERGGMATSALNFTLECDHMHHVVLEKDEIELGEAGNPTRRVLR